MHHFGICPWEALAEVGVPHPEGLLAQPHALTRCIGLQGRLETHIQMLWAVNVMGEGALVGEGIGGGEGGWGGGAGAGGLLSSMQFGITCSVAVHLVGKYSRECLSLLVVRVACQHANVGKVMAVGSLSRVVVALS